MYSFLLKTPLFYFMYESVFSRVYICIPHVCLDFTEAERVVRSPGIAVTHHCEMLCGCWQLNLGSWQEQQVLLTAKPSQLHIVWILVKAWKSLLNKSHEFPSTHMLCKSL